MKSSIQLINLLFIICIFQQQMHGQSSSNKVRKDVLDRHNAINENFKLLNPAEKTDISKPFKISGYGLPGATVEVQVRPISKGGDSGPVLVSGGVNTREPQYFTATVDANGAWSLPKAVSVSFKKNATDRRIHVIAGQYKGALKMQQPLVREIKLDNAFKVVTGTINTPLKITSHKDGDRAVGPIQILGTGQPGLKIQVSLYAYASVTRKKSDWEKFHNLIITPSTLEKAQIKQRHYQTYHVTIDQNGKWYIPVFQHFGHTDWMKNAFIPFAWLVIAQSEDPNYRNGHSISIKLRSE